jgi:predicted  nucleic acid-binding Zn-ribbon protein
MRINQNKNISDAMKESAVQLNKFENQNVQKQDLRDRMQKMKNKLRDMQVSIEQEDIKNENLKNVKSIELELRKIRDTQESEMLKISGDTQKQSLQWSMNLLSEVQDQDSEIKKESKDLSQKMQQRQSVNVEQLLQLIENDMTKNTQMISSVNMQIDEIDSNHQ